MSNQTSAPGKVILLGEHAVVYGIPAIAVPLSTLRVNVTWTKVDGNNFQILANDLKNKDIEVKSEVNNPDHPLTRIVLAVLDHYNAPPPSFCFEIKSDIPIASGLGSGAAVSTALGRAVARSIGLDIPNEILNQFVYDIEKIHHGTPSGIDNTVIVYEEAIKYVKDISIEPLKLHTPFTLLIADTGVTALTHESVGDVRRLYETDRDKIQGIFDKIQTIVKLAVDSIEHGKLEKLGQLMTSNHKLLQQLTVSSPQLDKLVDVAINAGSLGAKLSGGGRGGNMITLVHESKRDIIRDKLLQAGAVRVIQANVQ